MKAYDATDDRINDEYTLTVTVEASGSCATSLECPENLVTFTYTLHQDSEMHYAIVPCVVEPPECDITYDTTVFAELADSSSATIPGLSFDNQQLKVILNTDTITQTDQITTYFVYYSASSPPFTGNDKRSNKIVIEIEDPCKA